MRVRPEDGRAGGQKRALFKLVAAGPSPQG